MSKWSDLLENHAINQTLTQLLKQVNLEGIDPINGDLSEVRRFEKVLCKIQRILQETDPELISLTELDQLNAALKHQNIWNQVNSFASNHNCSHIANANAQLTKALANKSWLVLLNSDSVLVDIQQLEGLYDTLASRFQNLSSEIDSLKQEKESLEETIDVRRTEVAQQISQWQQQFSEAQENRSKSYQESKTELDKDIRNKNEEMATTTKSELVSLKVETTELLEHLSSESKAKHERIF